MKKLFSLVLALAMVLSLSGIAFAIADSSVTGSGSPTTTNGASVSAKSTQTLSAGLSWNDMYFIYDSGMGTWTSADSSGNASETGDTDNKITVTNNSAVSIDVKAKYSPDSSNGVDGAQIFESETLTWNTSASGNGTELNSSTYSSVISNISAGDPDDYWFMFTQTPTVAPGNTFAQVGTLTLQITGH